MRQIGALLLLLGLWPLSARAQLSPHTLRFNLDTDVIAMAFVKLEPERPADSYEVSVFSLGANQLGGSRAVRPATPLGLGFSFAITRRALLGLRTGLGYDVLSVDGGGPDRKLLALSLLPHLTFVPFGDTAKFFVQVGPLMQLDREVSGGRTARAWVGGFSTGLGVLLFANHRVSIDLGGFFEGRWGGLTTEDPDEETGVRDLRAGLRAGLSLWR